MLELDYDYAAYDEMMADRFRFLHETFNWLTNREFDAMRAMTAYPGDSADAGRLIEFAEKLRRNSSRRVSCQFNLGFVTMSGQFDLVTGDAYITDNGKYVSATDLPHSIDIRIGKANLWNVAMFYGTAKEFSLYGSQLQCLIRELERAGKLPPVIVAAKLY
jgi:hypothetical protein